MNLPSADNFTDLILDLVTHPNLDPWRGNCIVREHGMGDVVRISELLDGKLHVRIDPGECAPYQWAPLDTVAQAVL